ncbi:hypothetical protein INT45_006128 [Circinella minor]|uniref:15-cis-phytoene synthase n=1 Tax=Circinella minor TaxID=1195481 RepID=A0A8H7S5J9_9FUNG|nr:hypothetical protein INT45_006128 [Circinella minor]
MSSLNLVYALSALVAALVVYRPFITRLDCMRYIFFCTAAAAVTLFLFVSSLSLTSPEESLQQHIHTHNNITTANRVLSSSTFSQWKTPASTLSILVYNSYYYNQNITTLLITLWKDASLLALIAATSISFFGIISRWDFPILHVKPQEHIFYDFLYRHVSSVSLILLGSYSNSINTGSYPHQVVSIFCPVIAMLYLFSGPYLFRRWRVVTATACLTSCIGYFSASHTIQLSIFTSWTVADWFSISFIFSGATAALDYWDAIMNTYPYLASNNIKDHVRMQDPMKLYYWIHLVKTIVNLSSESELDPEPIEDIKAAIRSLGDNKRSWKTMSILFPSNLRQEMCVLYAWFRVCDDIVDDMDPQIYGTFALDLVCKFLNQVFSHTNNNNHDKLIGGRRRQRRGRSSFSSEQQQQQQQIATKFSKSAFQDPRIPHAIDWDYYAQYLNETQLATLRGFSRLAPILCPKAAFALTDAWKIDIHRKAMKSQDDLLSYAGLISGRFAELCTCVIMYKSGRGNWNGGDPAARKDDVLQRARATGQCLQLINIARDLIADSLEGRCYIPLQYMSSRRTYKILKDSRDPSRIGDNTLKSYAIQILKLADCLTAQAQDGINGLPYEVRDGVRAAFEIYSAISPAIRDAKGFPKRVKVPKRRQQIIAFSCIYGFNPGLMDILLATRNKILKFAHTKMTGVYKRTADISLPSN